MYRTHNCGELTSKNISNEVILSGWVQKIRNKGFIIWIDLRDRYGVTQIIFDQKRSSKKLLIKLKKLEENLLLK
jgi:aspartyl-tRNA synthetase